MLNLKNIYLQNLECYGTLINSGQLKTHEMKAVGIIKEVWNDTLWGNIFCLIMIKIRSNFAGIGEDNTG